MSCLICLELFDTTSFIFALDCGHVFHSNCIFKWNQVSHTCPQCRKYISYKIPIFFNNLRLKKKMEQELSYLQGISSTIAIALETNNSKLMKENLKHDALSKNFNLLEGLIRGENGTGAQREVKLKYYCDNKNKSYHIMKLKRDIKINEMKIYHKQNLLNVFRANYKNLETRYLQMKCENKRLQDELKSLQLSISNTTSKFNCNSTGRLNSKIPVKVGKIKKTPNV